MSPPQARSLAPSLLRLASAVAILATASGCVTRGYKLADAKAAGAPVALNVAAAPAPAASAGAAGVLETVIVYKGPGSWKREAYWDEYVVTLRNDGATPVTFATATLYSQFGDPVVPGDNPWVLEKSSKRWWQTNAARQTGTYLALGAGTALGAGMAISAAFSAWGSAMAAAWSGTSAAGVASSTAAAGTAGAALVVALPIVAGGTVYMNYRRKHQIQDEFNRRRLTLPRTLAPGETVRGSLFFRISPAPQRLALRTGGDTPAADELVFDLASLAGLHMRPDAAARANEPKPGAAP